MKLFTFLLLSCILFGCANRDVVGYLDDHPDFSPIVKREAKYEYQIVWTRSWQPIIYLKAHIEQDKWGEKVQAFVSYGSSEENVPKLKTYEISMSQWSSIVEEIDESIIWSYDNKCDQLAYKKRSLHFYDEEKGGCAEIIMMDGATISIAVSEPERQLGIYRACNDIGPCEPFGSLARAILQTIGRASDAN